LAEIFRVLKVRGSLLLIEPIIQDPDRELPINFRIIHDGKWLMDKGVGTRGEGLQQSIDILKDMTTRLGYLLRKAKSTQEYFELLLSRMA